MPWDDDRKAVVTPSMTQTKSEIEAANREKEVGYLIEIFTREFNDYQYKKGMNEGETADIRLKQIFENTDVHLIAEAANRFDWILDEAGWQDSATAICTKFYEPNIFQRLLRQQKVEEVAVRVRVTKPTTISSV